jgi:ubiquinone/menaquinone biosynthesis C-methylase UbiE
VEETGKDNRAALTTLLEVYSQRNDLKEAFPEAGTGDYQRLIRWAAGVAGKQWSESSYGTLWEYGEWYVKAGFVPKQNVDPSRAFKTWNRAGESLVGIERRIHDGVPIQKLRERAFGYIATLNSTFPWAMPQKGATILEIVSGVGYIMEAVYQQLHPSRIVGLDIAPAMIEKAKERFVRDKVSIPAQFLLYDGITIPMASHSVDYIYSVACLQHIPKPYVYNLFGEVMRLLRPTGAATLHFLAFSMLKLCETTFDFRLEIAKQLAGVEGHWHHFYSHEELTHVLTSYGAHRLEVIESEGSLWVGFAQGAH